MKVKEIKLMDEKIQSLERALARENSRKTYTEFERDSSVFLKKPFCEYANDFWMQRTYFQSWFMDIINWLKVESYDELLKISDKDLLRIRGLGTGRIKSIRRFGEAMKTGAGIRVIRGFTGR